MFISNFGVNCVGNIRMFMLVCIGRSWGCMGKLVSWCWWIFWRIFGNVDNLSSLSYPNSKNTRLTRRQLTACQPIKTSSKTILQSVTTVNKSSNTETSNSKNNAFITNLRMLIISSLRGIQNFRRIWKIVKRCCRLSRLIARNKFIAVWIVWRKGLI